MPLYEKNFRTGLFYIAVTVLFWGILPIALLFSLEKLDSVTVTWFRFMVAAVFSLMIQFLRGKLGEYQALSKKDWGILFFAGLFLIIDYVGFIYALEFIPPNALTIVSQTTPIFLALGGIIFFKERLTALQIACALGLVTGILLFFNDSLAEFGTADDRLLTGVGIAIGAALIWSFYALLQRTLFGKLSSPNILLFIYLQALILLAPLSTPEDLLRLDSADWGILIFCAFNTLIAYGAFSESLKHWETTQVSSVVALTPLVTILASFLTWLVVPEKIVYAPINLIGWGGVVLSISCVLIFNVSKVGKIGKIGKNLWKQAGNRRDTACS